ncbi:flavin reductase family protein [Kaistia algarum]|uniref:flavin reductase family protein n=1 Tax=Kaistia algarum TaxID=2083279 RepID=UPI000CE85D9B|nr:flavin reductase family protein [Kaistia algarum]MCX5515914.1 flavin reductase family protein [Kaistia algarum]PPE80724.1 flavin reductase family protein [Kaistia algarum]
MTTEHRFFDVAALSRRDCYKLLIGTVIPRPIALVTTVNETGQVNAAPFSFFNVLSDDPPILALGVENHADMSLKDTAHNIRMTEVFTVNIVSAEIIAAMNVCAVPFSPEIDELAEAGLTPLPGVHIPVPRIAEAPAAFECERHTTLEIGRARQIILGRIVGIHVRADAVDERNHVDPDRIDAIGRMGGHGYAFTRDLFDLPTMTHAEWRARQDDLQTT